MSGSLGPPGHHLCVPGDPSRWTWWSLSLQGPSSIPIYPKLGATLMNLRTEAGSRVILKSNAASYVGAPVPPDSPYKRTDLPGDKSMNKDPRKDITLPVADLRALFVLVCLAVVAVAWPVTWSRSFCTDCVLLPTLGPCKLCSEAPNLQPVPAEESKPTPGKVLKCPTESVPSPEDPSSSQDSAPFTGLGSETLNMASGDLECKSLGEKETGRSVAAEIEIGGCRPTLHSSSESKAGAMLPQVPWVLSTLFIDYMETRLWSGSPELLWEKAGGSELSGEVENGEVTYKEAKVEPETIEEPKKESVAGDPTVIPAKSVNIKPSDNISVNEKEVEAEFLKLSLGFKCDGFTLEKRVKLEERARDLAEENLKKEITNCLKLLESLTPLCEDDNQAQEVIKKLEKSITFLSQCTERVASRAEMLGAINQESRVSKAVEVMIQHVENLKRMYAKEHAELEELKQVLLRNERSFNPLENEEDCQLKKRSASLNSKPSSLRRVTIATLPRNIGNTGMVTSMENSERFNRRPSSWRILGSKQNEHRPSLQRFISTYSWADDEEEKGELKTKEDLDPPGEESAEGARRLSVCEKRNPPRWDVWAIPDRLTSWAAQIKTSICNAKSPWLSVAFVVLFAALISFLMGQFFQKSVDAAPTQDGDSWMSLEHLLWPFTILQHHRPPPV
ncbi:inositol 1,4,5-triphosphate receptor associated 2 [Suncus etruscus]|uniref:inositol 1,4,5-triphosphate receptor associated 2 n=1 Tax=Suncus etruscus TaxID=109475 RepID=UPI00210FC377|nr:inositol 1,4,5-triphosphate receptor associated 2 [Suncus etruscus]